MNYLNSNKTYLYGLINPKGLILDAVNTREAARSLKRFLKTNNEDVKIAKMTVEKFIR